MTRTSEAVVILPDLASPGLGQVEELRAAVARIRDAGKEVYAHADSLLMGQYLLACGASRISVVPTGDVLIAGLDVTSLHVRGLAGQDRRGETRLHHRGRLQGAVELFMREQPRPEADEMMNWLMDSWYANIKDLIAAGRKG